MEYKNEQVLPSHDEIIDDVVKSCASLKCSDKEVVDDCVEESALTDEDADQDKVEDDDFIDEVALKDSDTGCSLEELEKRKSEANVYKDKGNSMFKEKQYEDAQKEYTIGLRTCPLIYTEDRAVLYGNRAVCKMKLDLQTEAIDDCSKALELNSTYLKVLHRRAVLYEGSDKLDEALEDFKKVLELDPSHAEARGACMRLPGQINERNEKLKAQMLGSLKELGNKILRPFGLSTDNFQVQQDAASGGYSINFNQNNK